MLDVPYGLAGNSPELVGGLKELADAHPTLTPFLTPGNSPTFDDTEAGLAPMFEAESLGRRREELEEKGVGCR